MTELLFLTNKMFWIKCITATKKDIPSQIIGARNMFKLLCSVVSDLRTDRWHWMKRECDAGVKSHNQPSTRIAVLTHNHTQTDQSNSNEKCSLWKSSIRPNPHSSVPAWSETQADLPVSQIWKYACYSVETIYIEALF